MVQVLFPPKVTVTFQLYGIYTAPNDDKYIVTEYCSSGNLLDLIRSRDFSTTDLLEMYLNIHFYLNKKDNRRLLRNAVLTFTFSSS